MTRPRESDEWRDAFARKLLAQYVRDNDERYANDSYGRTSLHRYRVLSLAELEKRENDLFEERRQFLLSKMTYTSGQSMLGYLATLAGLLAFAGIIGGIQTGSVQGFLVGAAAVAYLACFSKYQNDNGC